MALTFVTPAPYSSFLTNSSCLCLFSFIVALLCRLWCLYALVLVISLIHLGNLLVLPSLLFSPFELAPLSRQCVSLLKGKRLSRYARQPTARHETLNTTRFETRLPGPTTLLTYSPWQTVANWNTRSSPDLKQETGTGGSNEPNCKEKPKPTKTFNIQSSIGCTMVRDILARSEYVNAFSWFHPFSMDVGEKDVAIDFPLVSDS